MSPCVATTFPSLTATLTPHPVPQKRHGAFDHFSFVYSESVITFAGRPGSGIPATDATVAAAECFMNSRRVIGMTHLLLHRAQRLAVLINERRRQHTLDTLDRVDSIEQLTAAGRLA